MSFDLKDSYTLSKLASNNYSITQDFINTACVTMFEDYIATFEQPEAMLQEFMNFWKNSIIENKKEELSILDTGESLEEMVAMSEIQQAENIKGFKEDVNSLGEIIQKSILSNIK